MQPAILVFRTSLRTERDIDRIRPALDRLTGDNEAWQCDLEDCDKVLRVVTHTLRDADIITVLHNAGYACAALED